MTGIPSVPKPQPGKGLVNAGLGEVVIAVCPGPRTQTRVPTATSVHSGPVAPAGAADGSATAAAMISAQALIIAVPSVWNS